MTGRVPSGAEGREQTAGFEDSFVARNNIHPVVFAFICLFLVFVLYQVVGGTLTYLLVGQAGITRDNVTAVRLLTLLGQIVFILLPTLLFAHLMDARLSSVFQWRMPRPLETLFAGLSLVFLQQVLQTYLFFQEMLPVPESVRELLAPLRESLEALFRNIVQAQSVPELLVVLLVVAVAPSIIEEMFFRGVVQHAFDQVAPRLRSAVVVGVIFALYHFNPFALVPLVVLGSYFGFLRYRSQSIIVAMIAHFLNNALAVVAVHLGLEHEPLLGPPVGSEAELASALSQLFFLTALFALSFFAYLRFSGPRAARQAEASRGITGL